MINNKIKSQSDLLQDEPIIGISPAVNSLKRAVERLAQTDSNIFIFGESGTGKEYIARHIYLQSTRQKRKFVTIDCSALGKTITNKDFFGEDWERDQEIMRNIGLLDKANQGILFLYNIDEMNLEFQEKFLQIIRDEKFRRMGGSENIEVDLRIISASNHDLSPEVESGKFKKELYYLLNTFTLYIPKLRERKQDIPELFSYFLSKYCKQEGRDIPAVPSEIFESILQYEWKGNVGELENTVQNLLRMSPEDELSPEFLPFRVKKHPFDFLEPKNLKQVISDAETFIIRKALRKVGGNQVKAAKLLGLHEPTLRFKMKKHSISKND